LDLSDIGGARREGTHESTDYSALQISLHALENLSDGDRQPAPRLGLNVELFLARVRQFVILRATIVVGRAPLRFNLAAPFKPVQRRIQRTLLYAKHIARHLLYTLGDSPSVLRFF
jgi:hypothetical protein